MRFGVFRSASVLTPLAILLAVAAPMRAYGQFAAPSPDSAFSIPKAQWLQPEELSRLLEAKAGNKPLVLQVGSHLLFTEAHIAGSEYAGPGSQETGRKLLRDRVAPLPRSTSIVLYCGCCPWERCPNIGPAFKLLLGLGFNNVKAVYIANNLGTDWVDKGYPVERGR